MQFQLDDCLIIVVDKIGVVLRETGSLDRINIYITAFDNALFGSN